MEKRCRQGTNKLASWRLATLLEGAGYLFSQAKFQNLLKAFYGVLSVKSW